MANTIKKVLDIVSTVIVAIIGLLAIAYIVLLLTGHKMYTVQSPSMEPTIKTGSVIIVKPVKTSELKVGDIITYEFGNTTATHRIHSIEKTGDTLLFQTKGDAKEEPDPTKLDPQKVIGKHAFTIPHLGKILSNILSEDNPGGKFIAIGVAVGLVLLVMLPGLIFEKDEKPKKGKETTAGSDSEADPEQPAEETAPDVVPQLANIPVEGQNEE